MTDHRLPFDHSYARLPERFFAYVKPTPVPGPRVVRKNVGLARKLGFETVRHHEEGPGVTKLRKRLATDRDLDD